MVKPKRLPLYESPLSSADELSDDEYVGSDDVCSEDLSDTGSAGEGIYDDLFSSDDEPEEPYCDPDPTLRWDVWQIDDFIMIETPNEKEGGIPISKTFVSVLWDWRPKPASKRYRSLEPLENILETHREECWVALRFMNSRMEHFREFCKTDWYGRAIIAAGEDYSCMFRAMTVAANLLKRPNLVPQMVIDDFFAEAKSKFDVDMNLGCNWKQFTAFLRKLRQHGTALKINEMIKNNYVQGGRRGPRVCASRGGRGQRKTIIDKGKEKPVEECRWMNFFAFVRPFRVW
ncbi:hypothetical protein PHYSODRAFT_325734 [Phytophthora sojae]|uniref:Uncharacterized protein n=1 Tax=Phytophthora sojae (strain P6497) TaxID=1094619 RepID=G4Z073_PHYSP|nr:hypothetical protein PHYSODRAFT_325734 [Phytophthora sojae]EGZ24630.1 hypothetical protein PHYSODRAFT_325734 [Phytophthora sojae]|eukprot:XP_009519918.1 hypothetical protein PHYSODRAFT_325734 [Phytophthora sojae]